MNNPVRFGRFLSTFIICGTILLSTGPAQATVADGVYAYEKGNYQKARIEWLPYAALGNTNALYNLGQLHRMGRGVETDYFKAKAYYMRAAEKGHVGAQRNLGTLYYFGRIGEPDFDQAIIWLKKAAISGDARSQFMIGTMNFNGNGGKKNNIRAYAWLMLAARSGLRNAANSLQKLDGAMTVDEIAKAKELAPNLISRQLSPDDVGLMIKQQDENVLSVPELDTPKPEKTEKPVQIPPKETPMPTEVRLDNFRVQIGSFRTEDTARKMLSDLKSKLAYIMADRQENIEFADLGEKGIYYRLQLSPFETRADADDLCKQLKENGQSCFVVKAP